MIRALVIVSLLVGSLSAFAAGKLALERLNLKAIEDIVGKDNVAKYVEKDVINYPKLRKLADVDPTIKANFEAALKKLENTENNFTNTADVRKASVAVKNASGESPLAVGEGRSLSNAEIAKFKSLAKEDGEDVLNFVDECAVMEYAAASNALKIKEAEVALLKDTAFAQELGLNTDEYAVAVRAGAIYKIVGKISPKDAYDRALNLTVPNSNSCNLFAATGSKVAFKTVEGAILKVAARI